MTYIITSELSETHKKELKKIGVPIIQSKTPKDQLIEPLLLDLNINTSIKNIHKPRSLFIGNDVNDLAVMPYVDLFCCPSDSHKEVLSKSNIIFESKGGEGVVKELVDFIKR